MEADLLGAWDQPGNGQPALAVRHRGDRVALEREECATDAVDGVCCGAGSFKGQRALSPHRFSLLIPVIRVDVLHHHREGTENSVVGRD